jgi:succinoglycan biosynthesis transport protein ExoP
MDAPLNFNRNSVDRLDLGAAEDSVPFTELVEQFTGFVRRQFPIFVFVSASAIALGLVYLFTTPASYTSHAMLLIDSSKLRVLQQQQAPISDVPIDAAQVETQVEILKSENIGLSVVKELKLTDDPEFVEAGGGLIGRIWGYLASSQEQTQTQLTRTALASFLAKRRITRVGRTYVLDIDFTSLDSPRSAIIANAIADAYIVDQLEAKYQATRRASKWLQDRIKELRQQASDADRAVLDYKEKNNIVSVGGSTAGGGGPRLLGEQQIEDMNTQLGSARAAAEEAKARLDRITAVMKKDVPDATVDATVTDTLHSEVINRLRNQYLDLAGKEAIWSARYGANHLAAVNLRTQMNELRRSILDELGRIAQGYKSDYEIAKSRAEGLERNLERLVANSQVTNRDRLGLRDLESTAKVYNTLYDSFLQRYMEAIQQQSFPITEARVISAAAAPERRSGPLTFVVLGIAAAIGVMLSFCAAVLREAVDRVFRTTRQIEKLLGINCLAVLPRLAAPATIRTDKKPSSSHSINAGALASVGSHGNRTSVDDVVAAGLKQDRDNNIGLLNISRLTQSELSRNSLQIDKTRLSESASARRVICSNKAFMHQVIDEPLSAFAEAFRSIKVAADISGSRKNNKVIGITSTVPGEGKSTVSSNLAQLMAHAGKQVILLDGDLRNPSVSRSLASNSKAGLLEVLDQRVALADAIYKDERTGLDFLPAVVGSPIAHTNEILASEAFKNLIDSLRKVYDYVIIDFPPIAPVVDVRATTQIIDSYIYVVEWGKTRTNLVQHQLQNFPELVDSLLGVVLNKADVSVLQRYETYYGRYYYKNYYGGQYPHSV